jgi:hypothetical protein
MGRSETAEEGRETVEEDMKMETDRRQLKLTKHLRVGYETAEEDAEGVRQM